MTFKTYIAAFSTLRYMFTTLNFHSSCGRKFLLATSYCTNLEQLDASYRDLQDVFGAVCNRKSEITAIIEKLGDLHDIYGTIQRLTDFCLLDDIDFFEIKNLALLSGTIKKIVETCSLACIHLSDLSAVVNVLNPGDLVHASFYIYDSYHPELGPLRRRIRELEPDDALRCELQVRVSQLEEKIRGELADKLRGYSNELFRTLDELARLDLLIAKATQIVKLDLCIPCRSQSTQTTYEGLFHPQVKERLQSMNKSFEPIHIGYDNGPVVLIGANMGGKTVCLEMVALAQLLYQFGFGIPARSAVICGRNHVMMSIGDGQDVNSGLSSFASQMKEIDAILKSIKRGDNILAVIDEPARTTNPVEGSALTEGLLKLVKGKSSAVFVTTHYNVKMDCRKLRVKGYVNGKMDYMLEENTDGVVPHEALTIAKELGVDGEWIGEAAKLLKESIK